MKVRVVKQSEWKAHLDVPVFSPALLQFIPTSNLTAVVSPLAVTESFQNILLSFHRNSSSPFTFILYQFLKNVGKLHNFMKKYIW